MIPRGAGNVLTQPYPVQTASAHTSAGNRTGYPIGPPLPSPLQHSPLLFSPGKQRAPSTAFYWAAGKALSLNNLLHRKRLVLKILPKRTAVACTKEQEEAQRWLLQPAWTQSPSTARRGVLSAWTVPARCLSHGSAIQSRKGSAEYLQDDKAYLAQQQEILNYNSSSILVLWHIEKLFQLCKLLKVSEQNKKNQSRQLKTHLSLG